MRTDVVGEHAQAAFHRLEGNPAIALEDFTWAHGQAGIVEAAVVEMPVHPFQPGHDPAAAGLQETDPQLLVTVAHPAPDHGETRHHHLHRVGHDVTGATRFEAVQSDLLHAAGGTLMETDRHIERFHRGPERLVVRMVDHLVVVGIGANEDAGHPELFAIGIGANRSKMLVIPSCSRANFISPIAASIDCNGIMAMPNRRSG
jgi:hypothetical protein